MNTIATVVTCAQRESRRLTREAARHSAPSTLTGRARNYARESYGQGDHAISIAAFLAEAAADSIHYDPAAALAALEDAAASERPSCDYCEGLGHWYTRERHIGCAACASSGRVDCIEVVADLDPEAPCAVAAE